MSEILAGLVGGILALSGAFGVQLVAERQAEKLHRVKLIAQLISSVRDLSVQVTVVRTKFESAERTSPNIEVAFERLELVTRIGLELTYLCPPSIATKINALLSACENLTLSLSSEVTPQDEFADALAACRTATDDLIDVLSGRYGKSR